MWQPSETAPKNGEKFLAAKGDVRFLCHWYRDPDGGGEWERLDAPDFGDPVIFTHWLPIPEMVA